MRRLGGGVRLGVDRPHRQAAKAQAAQQRPHRAFRQLHLEALLDHARQIGPAPAHHPMHLRVWALLDHLDQGGVMDVHQTWRLASGLR